MTTANLRTKSVLAEDVSASGETDWLDMEDDTMDGLFAAAVLKTLTGGSSPDVTVTIQGSPDGGTTVIPMDAMTAHDAADEVEYVQSAAPYPRWIRFSWVTTGTPSAATMDFFVSA